MSVPILLFTLIVLAFALALVTSVLVLVVVLARLREPLGPRIAKALLLPWGALALWRHGRHALPLVWASSIVLYVVLRAVAAAVVA